MPNIRIRTVDGGLVAIPSNAFRFLEEAVDGAIAVHPDARATMLYDLGGQEGLQPLITATSAEVIAEAVQHDPAFAARLACFTKADGKRIWMIPQHQNGVVSVTPPAQEALEEAERQVRVADAALAEIPEKTPEEVVQQLHKRVADLRAGLENQRSWATVHCRLHIAVPAQPAPRHFTYPLRETAEDVLDALEPEPAPRRKSDARR